MNMTLYWYDLETFGRNPAWDKVAQFAGIRTDENFNVIGEPLVLYCKITPDYLPDPEACFITGITPQKTIELGLTEYEFIKRIDQEFGAPGTCVVGFNSINFDDEFIRNLYYRNFKDPYLREWSRGNSRWDIINLLRGVRDFRPNGINWVNDESGKATFKLELLTKANGINHLNAHDALSDVEATIEMAKLVQKTNPKFFNYFFSLRRKEGVKKYIDINGRIPFYHTSPMYRTEKGSTTMLCPLAVDQINKNSIICFDLMHDPDDLLKLDENEIRRRVFSSADTLNPGEKRIELKQVHINKSPMVAPLGTLSEERSIQLGIDTKRCLDNLEKIKKHPLLTQKVIKIFTTDDNRPGINDPDFQIYSGGFFKDEDKAKFALIHNIRKEDLLNQNISFEDPRVFQMLWRFVCRNYPEILSKDDLNKWRSFCAGRTLYPPISEAYDFKKIEAKLEKTLNSKEVDNRVKIISMEILEYVKILKAKILN